MKLLNIKHVSLSKRVHLTDLVSTGVEEVAQADDVAVVQLPHDLQLTVLCNNDKKNDIRHITLKH